MTNYLRKLTLCIISLLICMIMAFPVLASPTVSLDGEQLSFDVPPTIEDGRTLVPLRAIFEAMGATVQWDQSLKTATAEKGTSTVIIKIGSLSPTINGKVEALDMPAKIVNGRTLAPLRFVGEAFGGSVEWNADTQTITIVSVPIQQPAGSPPPLLPTGQIQVHFIDIGQADSIYIQLPNHNDILIDGGNEANGQAVVDYLKAQWIDDIELLIATRPYEDHIGGLPAVFDAFTVEEVIDSGYFSDTVTCRNYMDKLMAEGADTEEDNYQQFAYGNVTLDILTGNRTGNDGNDYSVVCRLDTGDVEFMFMGDAEMPVEGMLKGDLSADILKVGHQGSSLSISTSFLSLVNPDIAIISAGTGNSYGHPAQETLDKFNAIGAKIYRTDLNGTIVIATDGNTYSIQCSKSVK